jgi:hypothetical protein
VRNPPEIHADGTGSGIVPEKSILSYYKSVFLRAFHGNPQGAGRRKQGCVVETATNNKPETA